MRTSRGGIPVVVLAGLALALSGCSTVGPSTVVQETTSPTSQQDFDAKMNACMAQQGWDAIQQPDGSYSFETTEEQRELFLQVNSACLELIGANLEPVKSDDEWRAIYESLVEVHECLNAQGLQLPEPPSFQAWQDMERNWGPYGDVPIEDIEQRLAELEGACPQPTVW